ncbi:rho GTPase-activating protein gacU-like [Leptopilina heterotoma]|uniref:rho GTPase-activating protein gacU-like n=1 Tax=Leptopilina heterotoma TaxID=63436 RepID=UPI001CA95DDA|nr:rho GTPase-activating protein gacU-like [Leptopilina heterotoma]
MVNSIVNVNPRNAVGRTCRPKSFGETHDNFNWIECVSKKDPNVNYYYNMRTHSKTWKRPVPDYVDLPFYNPYAVPINRDEEEDENDDEKFLAFVSDLDDEDFYEDDDNEEYRDNENYRLRKEKELNENALQIGTKLYYSGSRDLRKTRKRRLSDNDELSDYSQYLPINDFLEFDLVSENSSKRMRFSSSTSDQTDHLNLENLTLDQFNINSLTHENQLQLNQLNLNQSITNQLTLNQLNRLDLNEMNEEKFCESINDRSLSDESCNCSVCLAQDNNDASGSCDESSRYSLASKFDAPRLKQITDNDLVKVQPKKRGRPRKIKKETKKIQLTPVKRIYDMYGTRTVNYDPNYNFINKIDPNGLENTRLSDDTSDSSPNEKRISRKKKNCHNFLKRFRNPNLSDTETSSELEDNMSMSVKSEITSTDDNHVNRFKYWQIKMKPLTVSLERLESISTKTKKSYKELLGGRELYVRLERLDVAKYFARKSENLSRNFSSLSKNNSNLSRNFSSSSKNNSMINSNLSRNFSPSSKSNSMINSNLSRNFSPSSKSNSMINSNLSRNFSPSSKSNSIINSNLSPLNCSQRSRRSCRTRASYRELTESDYSDTSEESFNKFPRHNSKLNSTSTKLQQKINLKPLTIPSTITDDIWFIDDSQPMKLRLRKYRTTSVSSDSNSITKTKQLENFPIEKIEKTKIDTKSENPPEISEMNSIENAENSPTHDLEFENPFQENLDFIFNLKSRFLVENNFIEAEVNEYPQVNEESFLNRELENLEIHNASNKIIELMNFDDNSQNANDLFNFTTQFNRELPENFQENETYEDQEEVEENLTTITETENFLKERKSYQECMETKNSSTVKNFIDDYKESLGFCPIEDSENLMYENCPNLEINSPLEINRELISQVPENPFGELTEFLQLKNPSCSTFREISRVENSEISPENTFSFQVENTEFSENSIETEKNRNSPEKRENHDPKKIRERKLEERKKIPKRDNSPPILKIQSSQPLEERKESPRQLSCPILKIQPENSESSSDEEEIEPLKIRITKSENEFSRNSILQKNLETLHFHLSPAKMEKAAEKKMENPEKKLKINTGENLDALNFHLSPANLKTKLRLKQTKLDIFNYHLSPKMPTKSVKKILENRENRDGDGKLENEKFIIEVEQSSSSEDEEEKKKKKIKLSEINYSSTLEKKNSKSNSNSNSNSRVNSPKFSDDNISSTTEKIDLSVRDVDSSSTDIEEEIYRPTSEKLNYELKKEILNDGTSTSTTSTICISPNNDTDDDIVDQFVEGT